MIKNVSPFNGQYNLPYHRVGNEKKKKKRDLENLRYGASTKDQEEINICLNCPYPDCVDGCKRIKRQGGK